VERVGIDGAEAMATGKLDRGCACRWRLLPEPQIEGPKWAAIDE
jgi:hypothetical protein